MAISIFRLLSGHCTIIGEMHSPTGADSKFTFASCLHTLSVGLKISGHCHHSRKKIEGVAQTSSTATESKVR